MMKKVLLLMVCALMGFALYAQVSENFSDYTVDGKIAEQAQAMGRDYWTTWSDDPGSGEDGVVAEFEGKKCGHFTWGNDQILLLGEKTTGVWSMKCKIYVPTGKDAYFNIISNFTGDSDGDWAIQIGFAVDINSTSSPYYPGVAKIYAGSKVSVDVDFVHDTWIDVEMLIDLDSDIAYIYINKALVHDFQYSLGTFGEGCPKVIQLFDVFPPSKASISEFYISDIVFEVGNMEIIYSNNFDDNTSGDYVAESDPTWWTTWSEAPGTSEDALITDEQSASTPNSAKCSWGTDLMFLAGDKTDGAYMFDFDMYIPTGVPAYFNVLHFFDPGDGGQDSEWGVGIYLNIPSGQPMPPGTYVAQNGTDYPFTFPFDTWFPVSMYINLDVDLAIINIDGVKILEWQFSTQENGGDGAKQFGRVDFYPITPASVFYIDNVVYSKAGAPPPPPTLSVSEDKIEIKLQTNSIKYGSFHIVSEEEGTLSAKWSTYIDYSPLEIEEGDEFTLTLCDIPSAGSEGGIGHDIYSFDREIGIKLQPEDYKEKLGGVLKQVAFFIMPADQPSSNLTFRVYSQGPAENVPGELLAEEVLEMDDFVSDWNWVDITPVQLTGGEYWVTVAMYQPVGSFPLTVAGGPAVYGGDWIKSGDGGWGKVGEIPQFGSRNWAIQAKGDGKVSKVWGTLDQTYGTTFSSSFSEVKVTVNSKDFEEDTYTANIVIVTNVEDYPYFEIPLTMIVDNTGPSNNTEVLTVEVDGILATEYVNNSQYDYRVSVKTEGLLFVDIVVTPKHEKATVDGDIGVQPVNSGLSSNDFVFTVIAEDGTEKSYKLRVMADTKPAVSEIGNVVQLFPNPVIDNLYLKSDITIEQVTIYDLTGRAVKQVQQPGLSIDLTDLASGFYLLKVKTSQGETMQKLIKE
jgi:hypothetical protein